MRIWLNQAAPFRLRVIIILVVQFFISARGYAQRPALVMQARHAKAISSITVSPDGKLIGSGSIDGSIKLWDIETSKVLWTLNGHSERITEIAFSPDSALLASASGNQVIKLWDVDSGKELATLQAQTEPGWISIAFSPDGKYLASGGGDKKVLLWDIATRRLLGALGSHTSSVYEVAFSSDGKLLASAGGRDGTIRIWEIGTHTEKLSILAHSTGVTCVAFHPNNKALVSCGPDGLKLWDVENGRLLLQALTEKNETAPTYATFSMSGQFLASAAPNEIRIWQVDQLKPLRRLTQTGDMAESTAFGPDGKTLVSGGEDGLIRLWDINLGIEYRALNATSDFNQENKVRDNKIPAKSVTEANAGNWLITTPDGLFDGSMASQSQLYWRYGRSIFDVAPLGAFAKEFQRPGLLSEILSVNPPVPSKKIAPYNQNPPRVEIGFSDNVDIARSEIAKRFVSLKIAVTKAIESEGSTIGGVKDLRLFRNGLLIKQWPGDVKLNSEGHGDIEVSVPIVAGRNIFTAEAYSYYGVKNRDAQFLVIGAPNLKRKGTLYILAIGIDEYADAELALKYSVADAKSISEAFAASQREIGKYAKVEVVQLLNREAVKINILAAFDRLSDQPESALPLGAPAQLASLHPAQPEDSVFVFFACHASENGGAMFIAPYDLKFYPNDMERTSSSGISDDELRRAIEKIAPGELAIVLDTCNAGNMLDNKEFVRMSYAKQLYFLGASQPNQIAREYESLKHGLMTYVLVEEGLKAGVADIAPKDGQVTLREWLEYAVVRVPQLWEKVQKNTESRSARVRERVAMPPKQVPRVFYKLESESPAWVISTVKPSLLAPPK